MLKRLAAALGAITLAAPFLWAQDPTGLEVQAAPPTTTYAVEAQPFASGGNLWGSLDYRLTWIKGMRIPPLVTTSPPGTPKIDAGVFGLPTTTTLFGNQDYNDDSRSGVQLQFGYWFDPERSLGFDVGYFTTDSDKIRFAADSNAFPIIGRPITDATTGVPASILVSFPGSSTGSIVVTANSGELTGVHFDLRECVIQDEHWRLESLFGYRYLHYSEGLHVDQSIVPTGATASPGTTITSSDNFSTSNEFSGVDLGLRGLYTYDRLSVELLTKVAVGNLSDAYHISGNTSISAPGAPPFNSPGGLLALSTNSGNFKGDDWVAIPDVGVTIGWKLSSSVKLTTGYSFLYIPRVARAGDQVDTTVNSTFLPNNGPGTGNERPAFGPRNTDLWMQSVNFGVVVTY